MRSNFHSNTNPLYQGYNWSSNTNTGKIINNSDLIQNTNLPNYPGSSYQYSSNYAYGQNNSKDNYTEKYCEFGGIVNYGNNCYLNSGIQILVSCDEFVKELKIYNIDGNPEFLTNLIKEAIDKLLSGKNFDPACFISKFVSVNKEYFGFGSQSCSLNFIRTLLKNINDELLSTFQNLVNQNTQYKPVSTVEICKYNEFIRENKIYPESSLLSIFSGITRSHSNSICRYCQNVIDEYSFSYFIDLNIYLDEIKSRSRFVDVLNKNFEKNILTMDCPNSICKKEIKMDEVTKIIKLPDVLIFTLERYQGINNDIEIEPDEYIDLEKFVELNDHRSNIYELFAINIRFGRSKDFGHEICQVKRKGQWYEINDEKVYKISSLSKNYNKYSYGLFYKRK